MAYERYNRRKLEGNSEYRHLRKWNQGLTEEIALEFLAKCNYNMINALKQLDSDPGAIKASFIAPHMKLEEKLETLAYLHSLHD